MLMQLSIFPFLNFGTNSDYKTHSSILCDRCSVWRELCCMKAELCLNFTSLAFRKSIRLSAFHLNLQIIFIEEQDKINKLVKKLKSVRTK
ncbi:hypothetical protein Glove_11g45 [Diversispora epigaea]|uniref:Uncharacterized protein n=1 Tax=Diversispora epigaea TaxID=1348612 RepID=A0A397JPC7_9GLOM|nr:hypothetical protein Glove_11g45 [Diversispora epigaea]